MFFEVIQRKSQRSLLSKKILRSRIYRISLVRKAWGGPNSTRFHRAEKYPLVNSPYTLEREQWVARPLEEVFAFFSDAQNLEALTPPWMRFQILTPQPIQMFPGTLIDYKLYWHGVPLRWQTEITRWEPPNYFEDVQLKGPYRLWHHTHTFEAVTGGTRIHDLVRYDLPFDILGRIVHTISVRRNVEEIFAYRQAKIRELFGDDENPAARNK